MDDWYKASENNQDQLLDELMCEYIDGTMDPSVRSAFDELVSSNPTIARQIKGLTEAQSLLKQTGCSLCAPRQFQSRLRARLDAETGKIQVYGLPEKQTSTSASALRYSFLIVIFLWTGIALPQLDAPDSVDHLVVADEPDFSADLTGLAMTPAQIPGDLAFQLLAEPDNAISFGSLAQATYADVRVDPFELTLLAD